MADLLAVYNEFGLPGLVPHAIRSGTTAHQMLIDKIKDGDPLFFIRSVLKVPFLLVKDSQYQTYAFTSEEAATAKQTELADNRYDTAVEALPAGEGREAIIRAMYDNGVGAFLIDKAISIPLSQFAEMPKYDGQPNEEYLLRNAKLNGATYYYLQYACAQMSNQDAERQWARRMENAKFLLAAIDDPKNDYPLLTSTAQHKPCFLAYTDWNLMGADFTSVPAGLISTLDDLEELLTQNPEYAILLNRPTCHLLIDSDLILMIRRINNTSEFEQRGPIIDLGIKKKAITPSIDQSAEGDNWTTIDPTPDWLK